MSSLTRETILDESKYQFNETKKSSDHSSKKSWWIIGIVIGLLMNFLAFLIFHIFHSKEHIKSLYV
jgi:hypothetical protein